MPMWPFKSTPESILNAEDEAWQLEVWRWMFRAWGGAADFRLRHVVVPTQADFPTLFAAGKCDPHAVFADVARLARMDDLRFHVVEQVYSQTDDDGPLEEAGTRHTILWRPDEAGAPWRLTLRFALELAAVKVGGARPKPPKSHGLEDCVVDIAAAYLGFGVFGADAAIARRLVPSTVAGAPIPVRGVTGFIQEARQTALREQDWTFALALFLALKAAPIDPLLPFLKADLEAPLRRAAAYLKSKPEIVADIARTEPMR